MEAVGVESGAVDMIANIVKFLLECKENGEFLGNQALPSIYMVPSVVRDLSPSSYNPRVVSIGPLHKQDENLQRFEVQKPTYLHNMFHRLGVLPEKTLRECAEKVISSIQTIKACYGESMTYNDFELAKMMVIDGCFILEFIQSLLDLSPSTTNMLIIDTIAYDMLLIENQIPYFVLEIIFECTFGRVISGASFTMHMGVLLRFYKVFEGNLVVPSVSVGSTHILGFVHKYYQPIKPVPSVFTSSTKGHSAMELDRAGMNFKPNEDQNWAMAMKLELPSPLFSWFPIFMTIPPFSWFRQPTLRMPILFMFGSTEMVLRNLIIYEHSCNVKRYVTSYVYTMDLLIDTPQDIALLVKSKVLHNYVGSHENAANMINKLCKELVVTQFYYNQQWEEMDAYYNSYWPNTIAGLKRTYFNNPWNIIALFAAFVLFALTMAQTIYTIKDANSTSITK